MIPAIRSWVSTKLSNSNEFFAVAIFGSVARGEETPNDCDIVFVANEPVASAGWHRSRQFARGLEAGFIQELGIPYSPLILSRAGWFEVKEYLKPLVYIVEPRS